MAARLKELGPLVREYERLQGAAAALDDVAAKHPAPAATPRRRRARVTPSGSDPSARRARPQGSGKRGDQALALVKASPGITIPQIAKQMGIKQNYLYRVLPSLAAAGLVTKDGRGWKPTDTA
ncbi:MAG: Rrf2 family transcriptional regulator [Actinomycetota bacterium]|nr:Rrf2 family transcriptional regulator [Actinomycetota bacterium]